MSNVYDCVSNVAVSLQVRRDQVDQRGEQAAEGSDQRGNREPPRSVASAAVHQATVVAVAAHGAGVRVRPESQLLPAR